MNGILIIDKPETYTSRDVVNIVGKTLGTKKVGHTGTLDPLATGVLVVVIGRYTKLADILSSKDKEYIAEIKLGVRTDTLDITGNVLETKKAVIDTEKVKQVLKRFIGTYKMEVPLYSAVKVHGKKLYEYARCKEDVCLPIKEVQILELELLNISNDTIKFRAVVSKGTYIRSLIRDICNSLGVIGTMKSLRRTRQGEYLIKNAVTIDEVRKNNFKMLSLEDLEIPKLNLNEKEYFIVKNGGKLHLNCKEDLVLLLYNNEEIALYEKKNDIYQVRVMLKV